MLYPAYAGASIEASLGNFVTLFFEGSIEAIYWFFPAIISLTLAMPVLSLLVPYRKVLWYIVGVSFILVSVCPYLFNLLDIPWTGAYSLPVAGGYVAYALLGHLLATTSIDKKYRVMIYALAAACLALRYGFTYHYSYLEGATERALFSYTAFTAVLPSMAVFLLFKNHDWENGFLQKHADVLAKISGLSFGVYLVHMIVLNNLFLRFLDFTWANFTLQILCPFVVYLIAAAFTYALKKLPYLKELVP